MVHLDLMESAWSSDERVKVNENWKRIMRGFSKVNEGLRVLAGGEDVEELIERINTSINSAASTGQELLLLKSEVEQKLIQIQTAITNANRAADDADQTNQILNRLKGELETLQIDLNGIVQAEAQRITNESGRESAEQARATAETSRRENEAARVLKEQARNTAESNRENAEQNRTTEFNAKMNTAEAKIIAMRYLIDNFKSFDYDATATFDFPNLIKWNGNTFIALKEVTGITPVDDGINYRLIAQRGVDGTGAVSSVNGVGPDASGNVLVTFDLINNLISESTTAGLTAAQGKVLKELYDTLLSSFNGHTGQTDNPHNVTAEQLALGNVQNFGIATQADAEDGTSAVKYMTPQRTKQAIDKNLTTVQQALATHSDHFKKYDGSVTIVDANLAGEIGKIIRNRVSVSTLNLPVSWGGYVETHLFSEQNGSQRYVPSLRIDGKTVEFIRRKEGGTWLAWETGATSADIALKTEQIKNLYESVAIFGGTLTLIDNEIINLSSNIVGYKELIIIIGTGTGITNQYTVAKDNSGFKIDDIITFLTVVNNSPTKVTFQITGNAQLKVIAGNGAVLRALRIINKDLGVLI